MDEQIAEVYYSKQAGLGEVNLYKELRKNGITATHKQVKEFLSKQETYQLNLSRPKPKKYESIVAGDVGANFQIDIIIYDRFAYQNYKYILTVIDVYSRYAEARALTNHTLPNVIKNLEDIFKAMGKPNSINCDNEFNKTSFNTWAESNDIEMYFSQPDEINKNAIIERFNKTLAGKIMAWRTSTNKYDWNKALPEIINTYNYTYHTTIKHEPIEVYEGKEFNDQKITHVRNTFKVGDNVRLMLKQGLFIKGDAQKFSKTIYTVENIEGNKIYVSHNNILKDEFYKPYQLMKIKEVEKRKNNINEEDEDFVWLQIF